jgi:CheY-like chemotaxis protein
VLLDRLGKIDRASNHLLGVINDILDISKIEAGRVALERVPFRLGKLFQHLLSLVAQRASEKGLALQVDLPPGMAVLNVVGDQLRLEQILLNLIGNAIKFTAQGSIVISARLLEDSGNSLMLRFAVADTGIGIAPDAQQRIFSAFEQADGSTTRKYGGTGLGLVISKRLVAMMGGEIGLESIPDQGSTFWFTVRLEKGDEAARQESAGDTESAEDRLQREFAGSRVLLVEDEPVNREVSLGLLESVGLAVDLAEDGAQAVELARRQDYDLILMDMQMPNLNGVDATRAIRGDSLNRQTPILAMTANAFDEDRQTCLAAGMNDHIGKPVQPARLYASLLTWLAKGKGMAPD